MIAFRIPIVSPKLFNVYKLRSIDYLKTENEQLTEIKEGVHIIEEGGAFTVAIDGTDVFQVSRTLSEHPDHQGVYEHGFKLLTPDGSTEEIGRSEISGGVRLIGDHRHAEMGIGPSPSFHSTFPSANDNRHLYFTLGDTWNNRRTGVTKRDFVIHSWNNDFTQHVQHLILKPNGIVKARAFNTGDLLFEKGGDILWRMFEDDNGLYVEQMQTGKKFRFALQEIDEE